MATQVAIEDLETWLSNQPVNAVDTPYEIEITGLTTSNYTDIRTALINNLTKYVDLSETELPVGITSLTSCYSGCKNLIYAPTIPNTVITLENTFNHCENLKESPVIPDSVSDMRLTFNFCKALEEAPELPTNNSLTQLYYTFQYCSSLTGAPVIPDSVTDIGGMFNLCTSLEIPPVIPDGVQNMTEAFNGCTSLAQAPVIPDSVLNMNLAFYGCTSLEEAPAIPDSVINMRQTFFGCTSLEIGYISSEVERLQSCYEGCSSLQTIKMKSIDPSTISTYYSDVFKGCSNLSEFYTDTPYELKEWLTAIYTVSTDNIPVNPSTLTYKLLSSLVEFSITDLSNELSALSATPLATPFNIKVTGLTPDDVRTSGITGSLGNILKRNSSKYVDLRETVLPVVNTLDTSFHECRNLVYAPQIPEGVTELYRTFMTCQRLVETPNIPNSVTKMDRTFMGCSKLTTIKNLPTNLTLLNSTFYGCTLLTEIPEISESIETFSECFSGCTSLVTWKQKKAISPIIYNSCFRSCSNLVNIISDEPYELKEWLTTIYNDSTSNFPNDPASCNYYLYSSPDEPSEIPIGNLDNELATLNANTVSTPFNIKVTELTSNNLSTLKTSLTDNGTKYVDLHTTELPSVTSLDNTFENCTTLIEAPETPVTVTSMQSTYSGCTNLSEIPDVPSTVTSLEGIFNGCSAITEVPDLPSVTSYQNVFNGCINLEDVSNIDLTGAITLENAFKNCSSLEAVPEIPDGVTDLDSAFEGCSLIETVPSIPASVTSCSRAFYNCSSLEEISSFEVPLSVLETNAENCFYGCSSLTKIGVPSSDITEQSEWHVMLLDFGQSTVQGRVYDKQGNYVTIPETTITKDKLTLPIITDELLFTASLATADLYELISKMISYGYGYFNKPVIAPDKKSFILQADDPDNFVTNLDMGGGGTDIEVYPSEQAIIDDLANLEVGDIVASDDPNENETIAILNAKIQELEEKVEADDTYSETEVKTNKVWIDGKPIYRVVRHVWEGISPVSGYTWNSSNSTYTGQFTTNADVITDISALLRVWNGTKNLWSRQCGQGWNSAPNIIWQGNNEVYHNMSSSYGSNNSVYIIIEYTKTTD